MQIARVCQAAAPALVAALLVWVVLGRGAQALPPAGTDRLPVVVTANVASLLGSESVVFTGWAEIDREAPHDEGGVQVVDFEIVAMDLRGASSIGAVSITERPNAGQNYVSTGEIRALQPGQDFPASSFFDVFADVTLPSNPTATSVAHNEAALHLQPRSGTQVASLNAWPPLGATYRLDPIFGVDNDGDTQIDEDTQDEDGDGRVDEDRPGADPDTPGSGGECPNNPDCDGVNETLEGEDPPLSWCVANASAICNEDGQGQPDDDPDCVALLNSGNVNNMKLGLCVRDLTLQIAPELPSFSVAPGGPSNLHPADILGLLAPANPPGQPPATPVVVSGNDNFANSCTNCNIASLPFTGIQNTSGNTTEVPGGEEVTLINCPQGFSTPIGATVWYTYTPLASGTITAETVGSDFDTVLNARIGSALPGQRQACNDDISVAEVESRIIFPVTGGTTYHFQVGGFTGLTGNLVLHVFSGSPTPLDDSSPFVRIPCSELGLTPDGCDNSGTSDDLDGLSFGDDFPDGASQGVNFSVAPGAEGVQGSAVRTQRMCPAPEPQGDEFRTTFNNSNTLFMDGNGPVGTCASAFPFGLVEGALARDDLDALDERDTSFVDPDEDGTPDSPVYFSLAPTSPSLTTLGFNAGDVLKTVNGNAPTVFAARTALGLEAGDAIDGLCLKEDGDGVFNQDDVLRFSLASGSPTLAQIGAGAADILAPGLPNPSVAQNEITMGLLASDDLDAMKCQALYFKDPLGDTDGDTIPNGSDPDDDNDGCTDVEEQGGDPTQGGQRDPHNFWDLMDVFTGSPLGRDGSITAGDIAGVVARFGSNDTGPGTFNRNSSPLSMPNPPTQPSGTRANYHPAYDRGGSIPGGSPWNLLPADGAITSGDIAATVAQFGHSCL